MSRSMFRCVLPPSWVFAVLACAAAVNWAVDRGALSLRAEDKPDAQPSEKAAETFVGKLEGAKPEGAKLEGAKLEGAPSSARIALVVHEKKLVGYVCSHDEKFNEKHAAWYHGELDAEGRLQAAGSKGRLTGQRKGDQLTVELAGADGAKLAATASLAPADSAAGLYRDDTFIKGEVWVSGWIIDASGQVCGGRGKKEPPQFNTFSAKTKGKKRRNVRGLAVNVDGARLIPNQVLAAQVVALQAKIAAANQQGIDVQDVQQDTQEIQDIALEAQAQIEDGEIKLNAASQAAMQQGLANMAARAALIRQQMAAGASKASLLKQANALNGAVLSLAKRAKAAKSKKLNDVLQAMAESSDELVDDLD